MRSRASISSHPLHPMLVAFPIGLLVTSLIFDLIARWQDIPSLWSAGWYCVLGGLIGAAIAIIPGTIDLFAVVPPDSSARTRGYQHAIANILAVVAFIADAAYRGGPSARPDNTSLILSAVGVLILGVSGWLGATLVYRNQIAVEHLHANATPWKQVDLENWDQPVCKESELKEGQLILAVVQGARIAVGRCSEGLVAFSDQCTHKGGPLSDGALIGCAVQCPWHGSRFDVTTGKVISGPARKSIPVYEIESRAGKVFVFPKRGQKKADKEEAA